MTDAVISIEQLLADGAELTRIAKHASDASAGMVRREDVIRICARLAELDQLAQWRICQAALAEETRIAERLRRKEQGR